MLNSSKASKEHDFLNHLRKIFVISDEERFSEYIIMPSINLYKRDCHNTNEQVWKENLQNYLKTVNHHYLKNLDNKKFSKLIDNSNESIKSSEKKLQVFSLPSPNTDSCTPKTKNFESGVTKLLNSISELKNPFKKYLQFDGHKDSEECQTFTIIVPDKSKFDISIFKTAKICDLIGLACCKYIQERKQPSLKYNDVWKYSLAITEDDGKIDYDFPALDSSKFISFYGFKLLTLVENEDKLYI